MAMTLLQAAESATVSFTVRASVPDSAPVRVVGSLEALGCWDAQAALVLARSGGDEWTGRLTVPLGESFSFNVVRGDWEGLALGADGELLPDMWCTARDTTIVIPVDGWDDTRTTHAVRGEVVSLGEVACEGLPEAHEVWVVLPESYHADEPARYPVLYVHDGQDAFDAGRSTTGVEWRLDEIADSLHAVGLMPPIIVVAVAATRYRLYEYADTTLGEAYARFITDELKPRIDGRFRTRADRASTATLGHSLGGLIALLTAWWHADAVGHAACLAPFLAWGDEKVLSTMERLPKERPRLYLSLGDGGLDDMVRPTMEAACSLLASRGWERGGDLVCTRSRAEGIAALDADDLARALIFLFGAADTEKRSMQP